MANLTSLTFRARSCTFCSSKALPSPSGLTAQTNLGAFSCSALHPRGLRISPPANPSYKLPALFLQRQSPTPRRAIQRGEGDAAEKATFHLCFLCRLRGAWGTKAAHWIPTRPPACQCHSGNSACRVGLSGGRKLSCGTASRQQRSGVGGAEAASGGQGQAWLRHHRARGAFPHQEERWGCLCRLRALHLEGAAAATFATLPPCLAAGVRLLGAASRGGPFTVPFRFVAGERRKRTAASHVHVHVQQPWDVHGLPALPEHLCASAVRFLPSPAAERGRAVAGLLRGVASGGRTSAAGWRGRVGRAAVAPSTCSARRRRGWHRRACCYGGAVIARPGRPRLGLHRPLRARHIPLWPAVQLQVRRPALQQDELTLARPGSSAVAESPSPTVPDSAGRVPSVAPAGLHTLQRMYGCELRRDGSKGGFHQLGYEGRTFITFDKETLNWVAPDQQAQITQRKWDAIPGKNQGHKVYLEEECIAWLEKYLSYGKETLLRREPPVVTVSSRTEVEDGMETHVCRIDGFYPRDIDASWMRDGEVWLQDTLHGSVAPNADGTYHNWLSVRIDPKERDRYRCHVEHDSLQEPLDMAIKEPTNSISNLWLIIIACVVAALVLVCLIVGILAFIYFPKRRQDGYKAAPTSNRGSSSSDEALYPTSETESNSSGQGSIQTVSSLLAVDAPSIKIEE